MTWAATKTKRATWGRHPRVARTYEPTSSAGYYPPPQTIKGDIYHEGMQTINRF